MSETPSPPGAARAEASRTPEARESTDPRAKVLGAFNTTMHRMQLEKDAIPVAIAGRIMAFRHFGKASFITVKDRSGRMQAYVALGHVGEKTFQHFKTFDVGDIVYAKGKLFRTKTGELSVMTDSVAMLTKSLRPLPEKFHGLTDVEQKYRMRYVDLIMNDETRAVF